MIRIDIFDSMEECTEQYVERMLPLVSTQRREQALRYKHVFGRFCSLKSWLMLYDLVDERMKGLMEEWHYNEHGKPFFSPLPFQTVTPCFSISHCKEGIAVAVSEGPVGIDIEAIRHADEGLIQRVMNAHEQQLIARAEQPDRMFTRLWTQKEAVVKAEGTGICSFEQLQTLLDNGAWTLDTVEQERYIYSVACKG